MSERLHDIEPERVRPLRRTEYEQMVEKGLFAGERVELLRGALVEMTPQDPFHSGVVQILYERLLPLLSGRATVRVLFPLAVGADSMPEPDIAVVPLGDYRSQHPTTALLVIEVAGTSLRKDRLLKGELYAEAGVPEYWVVNLNDRVVEVSTQPRSGTYETRQTLRPGETLRPRGFPDAVLAVSDLVG